MSRTTAFLLPLLLLLTACSSPSADGAAPAEVPTSTPVPTYEPLPSPTRLPTLIAFPTNTRYVTPRPIPATKAPTRPPNVTPDGILAAFKAAGLQVEYVRKMTKQEYGMAPNLCDGRRFVIPSVGGGKGGRVFVCRTVQERDTLAKYYRNTGKVGAAVASWVFTKNLLLVQLDGDVKETLARKYEAAIP